MALLDVAQPISRTLDLEPALTTHLSCIVVTYNGVDDIGPCLRSLVDGGVAPEAILVVDCDLPPDQIREGGVVAPR